MISVGSIEIGCTEVRIETDTRNNVWLTVYDNYTHSEVVFDEDEAVKLREFLCTHYKGSRLPANKPLPF